MKNPYIQNEVLAVVTNILAGILGVEQDEITAESKIVDDLGADSLDYIELNTNLEKQLNLSLPKKGTLVQADKISATPELFYSNKSGLTDKGLALLENSLSGYKQLAVGMTLYDIFNLTTVNNLANLCHGLFNHLPETCPECGHNAAKISAARKVICERCSVALRPVEGNEAEERHVKAYLGIAIPLMA